MPIGVRSSPIDAWGKTSTTTTIPKAVTKPPTQNKGNIDSNYLKSLMKNLDLTAQQSDMASSCFIHAGLNSIVKATRDDDPNGWLMNKVNQTIQADPRTGDFTFNWANGNKMTITKAQIDQLRAREYQGKSTSDLTLATETAWFQAYPDQKNAGGVTSQVYEELFGLDAFTIRVNTSAFDTVRQKGVVSTLAARTDQGTDHVWTLDYEGPRWDLNNSASSAGFKNLPKSQGKNIDLTDAQLYKAFLNDDLYSPYISMFRIPGLDPTLTKEWKPSVAQGKIDKVFLDFNDNKVSMNNEQQKVDDLKAQIEKASKKGKVPAALTLRLKLAEIGLQRAKGIFDKFSADNGKFMSSNEPTDDMNNLMNAYLNYRFKGVDPSKVESTLAQQAWMMIQGFKDGVYPPKNEINAMIKKLESAKNPPTVDPPKPSMIAKK